MYMLTTPEQMKKTELVGHAVEYCLKGRRCIHQGISNFILVTKQDEQGLSLQGGETILYDDVDHLLLAASKSDEVKNDMLKALLIPAVAACSVMSNSCGK